MEPIITHATKVDSKELEKISRLVTRSYWSITYTIFYLIFLAIYIYMAVLLGSFWFLFAGVTFMIFSLYLNSSSFSEFSKNRDNRYLFDECVYTFEENKLIAKASNGGYTEKPYPTIVRTKIVGDYYLLFIDSITFFPIKKDIFQSEEDHQRFRELFNFNN